MKLRKYNNLRCVGWEIAYTVGRTVHGLVCAQPELDPKILGRKKSNPKPTWKTCQIDQFGYCWVLGCIGWF